MSKADSITDATVATQAVAETAAVDELRALAGVMMARAEDTAVDPMAVASIADPDSTPVLATLLPVNETEVARVNLRRAEAAWMRASGRLAAARVAWKLAAGAAATRALARFLDGLRIAPRGRRRQRRRAAARKAADPPGGSSEPETTKARKRCVNTAAGPPP